MTTTLLYILELIISNIILIPMIIFFIFVVKILLKLYKHLSISIEEKEQSLK